MLSLLKFKKKAGYGDGPASGASYAIPVGAASAAGGAAEWRAFGHRPVGLLLALLVLVGGCAARPAVEVNLVGLAPLESTLLEQRMRLDFRLQNYGERVLEATGLELTLNVNGRRLARGADNRAFRVDRLGETRVSAVVSTSLFDVANQLLALAGRDTFSYQLAGRVYLQGWPRSMRFERSGEISRGQLERLAGAGGRSPAPLRLE